MSIRSAILTSTTFSNPPGSKRQALGWKGKLGVIATIKHLTTLPRAEGYSRSDVGVEATAYTEISNSSNMLAYQGNSYPLRTSDWGHVILAGRPLHHCRWLTALLNL